MPFGQLVVGPPGSGKTTYCLGMQQWYNVTKTRIPILVNLDPANAFLPFHADIDITDLINVDQTMKDKKLGPNGGLLFAIQFLENNIDWLLEKIDQYEEENDNAYFIFDCPGQAELFTHDPSLKNIINQLASNNMRLVTINLIDSSYCTDSARFISALLLSLNTMLQLELPHINVLSKMDLLSGFGKLNLPLSFYTDMTDLTCLLETVDNNASRPRTSKFKKLNEAIIELLDDFNIVGFETLHIEDKESVSKLSAIIDRANGYIFGGLEIGNESVQSVAVRTNRHSYLDNEVQNELDQPDDKYGM